MIRRGAVAGALGLGILAAGCGSTSSGSQVAGPTTSPTQPAASPTTTTVKQVLGCTAPPPASTRQPQQFTKPPPLTIARTTYTATLVTNCGTIVIALNGKAAPQTVNSFAFLAGKHFFDNTICQRLTIGSEAGIAVLQCGDPTGTGTGGPGYTLPDENLAGATYPTGTVAMANRGPNTGGSQFFLVYGPSQLTPSYTPFGRVVSGLDVVRRIASAGTDNTAGPGDGHPTQQVVIESFRVTKGTS